MVNEQLINNQIGDWLTESKQSVSDFQMHVSVSNVTRTDFVGMDVAIVVTDLKVMDIGSVDHE